LCPLLGLRVYLEHAQAEQGRPLIAAKRASGAPVASHPAVSVREQRNGQTYQAGISGSKNLRTLAASDVASSRFCHWCTPFSPNTTPT
jgi:hypothetical protein